jgi:hypothetical protein
MRGIVLFFLRVAIGILVALVGSFFVLLANNAPSLPDTPFAGIAIEANHQTVHLPNRIFTCAESPQQFQCQTDLQERVLNVTWQRSSNPQANPYQLSQCKAIFAGQPLGCTEVGMDYIGRKGILSSYTLSGTGLNPTQIAALRRQYLWINSFTQVNEDTLFRVLTGVALAIGLLTAALTWLYPGRAGESFASLVSGVGVYYLAQRGLGSIPYDQVTTYSITSDIWNWLVPHLALAMGILTGIATARLLWVRSNRLTRAWVSLLSGLGLFGVACVALLGLSTTYGLGMPVAIGLAAGLGLLTATLLWRHDARSIQTFVCVSSGLGAFGLLSMLFLLSLLELGYVD